MDKLKNILIFVSTLSILFACHGPEKAEKWNDIELRNFDVSDFRYIHLEGGFKVVLAQAEKAGLKIKADEDDFKFIDVEVRDSVLDIETNEKHFSFDEIVLYIDFKQLEKLHIEGGVRLETADTVSFNDFLVHVQGGAKINIKATAQSFDVIGEGGTGFILEGISRTMNVNLAGASYIDAEEFKCDTVNIKIEGVGGGTVYASSLLNAEIDGVGKIHYKGNPTVNKTIGGLGFVSSK